MDDSLADTRIGLAGVTTAVAVCGSYADESTAIIQARDTGAREKQNAWQPGNQQLQPHRVTSIEVEGSPLAWTPVAKPSKTGWTSA